MAEQLVHTIAAGNTLRPIGFKLRTPSGRPVDLTNLTPAAFGIKNDGTEWFALDAGRVTKHPVREFHAGADDWLLDNDNPLEAGDQILVGSTGGNLPNGLAPDTRYFVRDLEPNRWKVSLSPGGQPVDITNAGSGGPNDFGYVIIGSGLVRLLPEDVAEPGIFWLWIQPSDAADAFETFPIIRQPDDRAFRIEIVKPR